MILLIDNYDSFSYNLYQYIGEMNPDIVVIRNDEKSVREIIDMHPERIIISPGPGRPEDAGIIIEAAQKLGEYAPILGVCLGHQAICAAFGADIVHASKLMHGKSSEVILDEECPLFKGCSKKTTVARYHSLAVDVDTLPNELKVTAKTLDDEVMAIMHRTLPVFGMQFHPESILTSEGKVMLRNFLDLD